MRPVDYTLYAVLDVGLALRRGTDLAALALACAEGGAGIVQVRDAEGKGRRLFECALRVLPVTRRFGIPLIVNDMADVALAVGADGVHLGREDLPIDAARKILPRGALVGATARTPEEAARAEALGASYLGVGSLFASGTKSASRTSPEEASRIAAAAGIPVVAIGGIDAGGAARLAGLGLAGVAVCGALVDSSDPERAARSIRTAFIGGGAT